MRITVSNKPQDGQERIVMRFALVPTRIYASPTRDVYVWLERVWKLQKYLDGYGWVTNRTAAREGYDSLWDEMGK